jgi:CheY-like chemotaxis protein
MPGLRKRVLWVDDEIELLRAHIMFLETRGYNVTPVFSGDDAVELVVDKGSEFDIVLLDEQMPGRDGLATLVAIKDARPDLPVVMVTKSEEENLMEQAIGKKIDGYLTKPVNPSQILLICKRLLDSKQLIASEVKQQFLRHYSENTTVLRGRLETSHWIKLYENFARWDLQLDALDDEGLRQAHAEQKSEGNAAFGNFIAENYGGWIRGQNKPPLLSAGVLDRYVDPLLRAGEQVFFIVISGMRLDQYLGIEEAARKYFSVQRHYYNAILPTDTYFARSSLMSGLYPDEIAEKYKEWSPGEKDQAVIAKNEKRFLADHLSRSGIKLADKFYYTRMTESAAFQSGIAKNAGAPFAVIVADFANLFTKGNSPTPIVQEIAPDERALRAITRTWFEHSVLLQFFRTLSKQKCAVVLTSDHGSVYCTRKTEIYGANGIEAGLRYKFGKDITADERRAVTLTEPQHYRLPMQKKFPLCIIAKENFFFTAPENFRDAHLLNRNSFQQGGISMEEMIMPLAVFRPL